MIVASNVWAEIEAQTRKFMQFSTARDAAATASMYLPDAIVLAPDSDFVRGREAIQKFWQGFFDTVRPFAPEEAQVGLLAVEQLGDSALEIGWCTFKAQPVGSSEPVTIYIKFFCRCKQENGEWKLLVHSLNSNPPPAR